MSSENQELKKSNAQLTKELKQVNLEQAEQL